MFTVTYVYLTALFGVFVSAGIIGSGYFCSERAFSEDVHVLIAALVPATRKLWQKTKVGMHVLQHVAHSSSCTINLHIFVHSIVYVRT